MINTIAICIDRMNFKWWLWKRKDLESRRSNCWNNLCKGEGFTLRKKRSWVTRLKCQINRAKLICNSKVLSIITWISKAIIHTYIHSFIHVYWTSAKWSMSWISSNARCWRCCSEHYTYIKFQNVEIRRGDRFFRK